MKYPSDYLPCVTDCSLLFKTFTEHLVSNETIAAHQVDTLSLVIFFFHHHGTIFYFTTMAPWHTWWSFIPPPWHHGTMVDKVSLVIFYLTTLAGCAGHQSVQVRRVRGKNPAFACRHRPNSLASLLSTTCELLKATNVLWCNLKW